MASRDLRVPRSGPNDAAEPRKNVLVIDDEELVRTTVRQILERAGFAVREAPNGKVGVELFGREPADVVITDIIMPGQEGIETIMLLRAINPDVKVIAISGGGRVSTTEYLTLAEQVGAAFTFAKPLPRRELVDAVKSCVNGSRRT